MGAVIAMTWLLILGLLAAAIGPLFLLLPSARERQQAALRQYALSLGLKVCSTRLDNPFARPEDRVDASGRPRSPEIDCLGYRLPLDPKESPAFLNQEWRLDYSRTPRQPASAASADYLPEFWYYAVKPKKHPNGLIAERLVRALACLPDPVLALECSPSYLAVCWQEWGGTRQVDSIYQALTILRQ